MLMVRQIIKLTIGLAIVIRIKKVNGNGLMVKLMILKTGAIALMAMVKTMPL